MSELNDGELLNRYVRDRSEPAFAELVRRHLALVYSTSLRFTCGDAGLADEPAQMVFCDLARKATSLTDRLCLTGWCYTSARFAATKAVRAEMRRKTQEQDSMNQNQIGSGPEGDPEQLRGMLDDALGELSESDREFVLLRYYEQRDFKSLARTFELSDDAARKRVERALEKLRGGLERRGIHSTGAAIASALGSLTLVTTPPGLSATVTSAALASSALGSAGFAAGLVQLIHAMKVKTAVVGTIALAGLATGWFSEWNTNRRLAEAAADLRQRFQESPRVENEPAVGSQATSAPNEAEHLELLRLRGEVGMLRRGLAEASNLVARASALSTNPAPKPLALVKSGGKVSVTVPRGQTIMTGGWPTIDGKRLMLFVTPSIIDSNGKVVEGDWPAGSKQLLIEAKLTLMPDSAFRNHDGQVPDLSGENVVKNLMPQSQVAGLMHRIEEGNDQMIEDLQDRSRDQPIPAKDFLTDIMTAPSVMTLEGRPAAVSIPNGVALLQGKSIDLGFTVRVVGRAGNNSIDLDLEVEERALK